ncbi:MAG: TolC family protein, partial [Pseudomonadota bacterium]
MAGTACKLQIAAAGVLLGACASLAPQHEPPPLPVPDRYAEEAADVAAVTAPGWRDYFADPVLTRLIEQALANNRDLRIAALRVREAQAAWRIQRAEQWPVLTAGAEATRARTPADFSVTGQPLLGSQYQVGLAVPAWELDFWGRIESLKEAALQEYLATDAARRAAALSLVTQLAEQYLALCELDERLAIAGATVASRSESLRIFTRRYEVGS